MGLPAMAYRYLPAEPTHVGRSCIKTAGTAANPRVGRLPDHIGTAS
jgi:hypothetical protein